MGWVFLLLVALYAILGKRLEYKAYEHLKNPEEAGLLPAITEASAFTDEGLKWRMRALKFWRVGGAAIALIGALIWLVQHFR